MREIILNDEHYFTSPAAFNDPFDCRPVHRFGGTEQEVRQYLDRLLAKHGPAQTSFQRSVEVDAILSDPERDPRRPENARIYGALIAVLGTDRTGVLCLSGSQDIPLMWSHYADSHAGVCLGFDPQASHFAIAQPVRYSSGRPFVDPTVQNHDQMLDSSLYTKSLDWAYENEWRILLLSGPGKYKLRNALKSISVGASISNEHFKAILTWAKSLQEPVEIFRATRSASSYAVELQRYPYR